MFLMDSLPRQDQEADQDAFRADLPISAGSTAMIASTVAGTLEHSAADQSIGGKANGRGS